MSKDPAFLFYSADFLVGTVFMTDEQIGKYIKLLCLQHQHGSIKKDHFEAIVGTNELIREKFKENCDGWFNERLKLEADKRNLYSESRKRNRTKHMSNICSTYVEHMENENENIDIWLDKKYQESKFNILWDKYPRRVKRKDAFRHFKASVKNDDRYLLITKALGNYAASIQDKDPEYIQVGSTWFNNWEDWITDPVTDPVKEQALRTQQKKKLDALKRMGM